MVYSNRQARRERAVSEMGFDWLCDDVVVYIELLLFLFLTPSTPSISLFSKNRSDAAGGCS